MAHLFRQTHELLKRLNLDLDPERKLGTLTVANQQMVEIAKAVSYDSDVLIMDEPTSAITDKEVDRLFEIIAQLKSENKAIVYITHKMNEVFTIADDISVFRDGRQVGSRPRLGLRPEQADLADGRPGTDPHVPQGARPRSAKWCFPSAIWRSTACSRASPSTFAGGKSLGIAGLIGAGRTNVAEAIFGVTPATAGEIRIDGKPVAVRLAEDRDGPRSGAADGGPQEQRPVPDAFGAGKHADRQRPHPHIVGVRQAGRLSTPSATKLRDTLRIKTPTLNETIGNLSGGNQQKALIARCLMTNPRILILDEPTRGIDVGAKAEIHRLISDLAAKGLAIIMISSEMPEILGMSDRIMVMHEGHVSGFLDRAEATQEKIMHLAAL